MELREVTLLAVVVRIFAAVLFGGVVGLERGMKNRPAGLRTYMLVSVGSCLIMLINQYIFQATGTGDPMRLGAQVVSGVGFLGAGTIVLTRRNHIRGLTTAAGLWAAAGVGLALGVGFYEGAAVAGLSIFLTLTVIQRWDNKMRRHSKMMELYLEIAPSLGLGALLQMLRDMGLDVEEVQLEPDVAPSEDCRAVIISLKAKKRRDRDVVIDTIRHIDGVMLLEEL